MSEPELLTTEASARWQWRPFWFGLITGIAVVLITLVAVVAVARLVISRAEAARPADYGFDSDVSIQVAEEYLNRTAPDSLAASELSSSTGASGVFGIVNVSWGAGPDEQAMEIVVNTATRQVVATVSVDPDAP